MWINATQENEILSEFRLVRVKCNAWQRLITEFREELAIETNFRCHVTFRLKPNGEKMSALFDKTHSTRYIALRCRCHCLLLAVNCN